MKNNFPPEICSSNTKMEGVSAKKNTSVPKSEDIVSTVGDVLNQYLLNLNNQSVISECAYPPSCVTDIVLLIVTNWLH